MRLACSKLVGPLLLGGGAFGRAFVWQVTFGPGVCPITGSALVFVRANRPVTRPAVLECPAEPDWVTAVLFPCLSLHRIKSRSSPLCATTKGLAGGDLGSLRHTPKVQIT